MQKVTRRIASRFLEMAGAFGHLIGPGSVVLVLTLSACSGTSGRSWAPEPDGSESSVTLRVDNLNFNEATLWALEAGSRTRLGVIGGKSVRTFQIPWNQTRRLRIRIDLLSGGAFTTQPLSVDPGDRLDLIIESPLRRSILR